MVFGEIVPDFIVANVDSNLVLKNHRRGCCSLEVQLFTAIIRLICGKMSQFILY